jgi:hypothetical protein
MHGRKSEKRTTPYSPRHLRRLAHDEASKIQEEEKKRAIATMAAKFPHLYGKLFSEFDIFRFRVVQ